MPGNKGMENHGKIKRNKLTYVQTKVLTPSISIQSLAMLEFLHIILIILFQCLCGVFAKL